MPTNDERREVAARLRKHEPSSFGSLFDVWREIALAVNPDGGIYKTLPLELSCLIEPEPERTCRNLSKVDDVFVCSECQNETHGFMVDKFGCTVGFGKVVCKCPNCGAKVVN